MIIPVTGADKHKIIEAINGFEPSWKQCDVFDDGRAAGRIVVLAIV